jgi:2-iminobutanoate/2-iminopropanoate deaminase
LLVQWSGSEGYVQIIHTEGAPSHTGPVPQAVEAGGWIYVSALFGADPATHAIPAEARVGIVMRALQRDRPVFNQVWAERFGEHRPARSAIEAADFGRKGENARFMIEVVAFRG